MTHRLARRHEKNPLLNPLVVSLRYRCDCATNEVLSIQVVLDEDITEEHFTWVMHNLWRDLQTEVQQHLKGAA